MIARRAQLDLLALACGNKQSIILNVVEVKNL